jgi:hypothetical protein
VAHRLPARREAVLLAGILAAAAVLRLYGLNWDGGQWLHPDERQIYFVTLGLKWPNSLAQALSPDSPLNPHFFSYGSFPLYLLRLVAALAALLWPALGDPDSLHRAARPLSALFDLGTVYLTYRLTRRLWPSTAGVGLLAAALTGLAVLSIQLTHFYTADTLLTFLVMLALNLAAASASQPSLRRSAALGLCLGLALATKLTAAPLVVPVLLFCAPGNSTWARRIVCLVETLAVAGAVFFAVQPYALIDWQTFVDQAVRESQIAWGRLDVPYTRQYAGTLPYLYPIVQTAVWGLGLPLGLVGWSALAAALVRWLRHGDRAEALLLAWAGPYLALAGALYAKPVRYMLPLIPILCLLAAHSLAGLKRRWAVIGGGVVVVLTLIYALAFVSIYATPHSWISASEWIYRQVPAAGSTLAVEEWDMALPLPLDVDGRPRRSEEYEIKTLPLYDEPDDAAKWTKIAAELAGSDYLIVASRRLYGSIPHLPDRYPAATRYYELLAEGAEGLGLEPAGEFSRGPAWLNPRLWPLSMGGRRAGLLIPDESLVVYDHPRALIWRNTGRLPAEELLRRLANND